MYYYPMSSDTDTHMRKLIRKRGGYFGRTPWIRRTGKTPWDRPTPFEMPTTTPRPHPFPLPLPIVNAGKYISG